MSVFFCLALELFPVAVPTKMEVQKHTVCPHLNCIQNLNVFLITIYLYNSWKHKVQKCYAV